MYCKKPVCSNKLVGGLMWRALLQGVTGSKMESVCDLAHITLNKNAVVGDVSAMTPGGVRIGAPAMSSRGLVSILGAIFPINPA